MRPVSHVLWVSWTVPDGKRTAMASATRRWQERKTTSSHLRDAATRDRRTARLVLTENDVEFGNSAMLTNASSSLVRHCRLQSGCEET